MKKEELKRITKLVIPPSDEVNDIIVSRETSALVSGIKLIDLLKRPQITYECLEPVDSTRPVLDEAIFEQIEVEVKYEGYIKKQLAQIEAMRRLEKRALPKDVDYMRITGLRLEAQEKLQQVRPESLGQASRISGVSPADISFLLVWLSSLEKGG